MHPLDRLTSPQEYPHLFCDARFWAPYARQACAQQGMPADSIRGAKPGTYPTVIVDQRVVVKFFGPLFHGAHALAVERSIGQLLANQSHIPSAALLAQGALEPRGANWPWPYLIYQYVPGESVAAARPTLSTHEMIALAEQLGGWVRALHALPIPTDGPFDTDLSGYRAFLSGQRASCAARLTTWGSLPPALAAQAQDFLPTVEELVQAGARAHLVHADLTDDHLLGSRNHGEWKAGGLIDFGDARTATLEYELPALSLDLMQGDRRLLGAFLNAYGYTPPPDFARRALSFCLLHEFDVFAGTTSAAQLGQFSTLAALADRWFSI